MSTTPENIQELLNREPFLPFRLIMTSGKTYEVLSANSAALLKSEVFIVSPYSDQGAHVPFSYVASIETLANGQTRRSTRPKCR